ncbi:MAG: 3-methyl-2-oxobutanoate hydroxymethyltransferase [Candidatus Omnitrophota bacterium]
MSLISVRDILLKKKKGEKIAMLTAYDYAFAKLVDEAGIDMILVGDSLANVVLGLESTKDVTTDQMIYHTQAAARGIKNALLIGDMPFEAYQKRPSDAVKNAKRFIHEGKCQAVKVEWFADCLEVVKKITAQKIPVMGHVGLTPQTAQALGGFKVQGKDAASAKRIIDQALALEKAGCFSIVLECIPDKIAQLITKKLKIPPIGIGAGPYCDGQVLVLHDLLGLFDKYRPKFVKTYENLGVLVLDAVKTYRREVLSGQFPSSLQSFTIQPEEFKKIEEK